ncbi:MAG: hypothetical protein ACRDNZ_06035 [Streptosporangiaceae bacterium]
MLNNISMTGNVPAPRPRSGRRAVLPVSAVPVATTRALLACPLAVPPAAARKRLSAPVRNDRVALLLASQAAYMARIAATSGALGPHPAREPEPV